MQLVKFLFSAQIRINRSRLWCRVLVQVSGGGVTAAQLAGLSQVMPGTAGLEAGVRRACTRSQAAGPPAQSPSWRQYRRQAAVRRKRPDGLQEGLD